MAALTAARKIPDTKVGSAEGFVLNMRMPASTQIWEGGFVSVNTGTGYAVPASDAASREFVGIALESKLSSGVAGADTIKVLVPDWFEHDVTTGTQDDIGKPVYIADDQTLDIATGTNSIFVGWVGNYISGTRCVIKAKPLGQAAV